MKTYIEKERDEGGQGGNAGEVWEGKKKTLGFPREHGNRWECGREHGNVNEQERMKTAGFMFPS